MSDLFFFRDDDLIQRAKAAPWKQTQRTAYRDKFEMSYSNIIAEELSDDELLTLTGTSQLFDVECFPNYFMVAFRSLENGKVTVIEHPFDLGKLRWFLENFTIIGYNSDYYDVLMLQLALTGASTEELFKASCDIVVNDLRKYDFRKKYKLPECTWDHIDLIAVAPLVGSLKLYAGRLHAARMQDLPVHFKSKLTPEQKIKVREYCINDLESTRLLVAELEPAIDLRCQMSHQYEIDVRSKSDAQIAETVIVHELTKLNRSKPKRPESNSIADSHTYRVPSYVAFRTPVLQQMLKLVRNARFHLDGNGYIVLPTEIEELKMSVGQCIYKMGIGGLHSTESKIAHLADDETLLLDRDVASYYPAIILNQCLYPKHLGQAFLQVYRSIVERRLIAKKEKNKVVADSLKITINGSFGKFGNRYSVLYSPDLLIQVTITGQLTLLMLIEMIEDLGIPVVSANTDGVLIKCPVAAQGALQERIRWWERLTGFETEETRYRAVYSRDVNNYIAHKEEGGKADAKHLDLRLGMKIKGVFGERGSAGDSVLSKNPENLICMDAVMLLIANGTPIEKTIRECQDIRRFVTIRNVTGGARKTDTYLGKVIRWYFSTEMKGEINRATTGDKIPKSDGARPLMELPTVLPSDIDYNRYIDIAIEILHSIAYYSGLPKASKRCLGALFAEDGQTAYHLNS